MGLFGAPMNIPFVDIILYILINISSGTFSVGNETQLATHTISLEKRYSNAYVNDVFKDNILLNIAYMEGTVNASKNINWEKVEKPFHYEFSLKPNETFAFHGDVLPEYSGKVIKTTNAHFSLAEGFKSDGYLAGDGVCHLASLIYWAARDAGLEAKAPSNHDFMPIPEISKEYGVAIYNNPNSPETNELQNLYITNSTQGLVTFKFDYDGHNLTVSIATDNPSFSI